MTVGVKLNKGRGRKSICEPDPGDYPDVEAFLEDLNNPDGNPLLDPLRKDQLGFLLLFRFGTVSVLPGALPENGADPVDLGAFYDVDFDHDKDRFVATPTDMTKVEISSVTLQ